MVKTYTGKAVCCCVRSVVILEVFLLLSASGQAHADVAISVAENQTNVFAGRETCVQATLVSGSEFKGRLVWSLSVAGRTIQRGERSCALVPATAQCFEMSLQIPPVKEGIVLEAVLSMAALDGSSGQSVARLEKQLFIFHNDPFAGRQQWLRTLSIHLFDPLNITAEKLTASHIPYKRLGNIEVFSALGRGILIIGEGLSLDRYRGIDEMMLRALEAGIAVICLAPAEGRIAVPAIVTIPDYLQQFSFKSSGAVKGLDKRLALDGWSLNNGLQPCGIGLQADRGVVTVDITQDPHSWPWLEIHAGAEGKKLVVCCYGIIEQWDSHPASRYLFSRMLEYVWGGHNSTKN